MGITIFGKTIPLYGICFFCGIAVAAGIGIFLVKRRRIVFFDFTCGAVYAMIGAILGAKLLFLLVSWKKIMELGLPLEAVLKGGFVFYGGLLGGALGLFIYGKQFKTDIRDYLDICATVLPLGHAFGRVGCFFAGCCYGIHYEGIGSFTYTDPTSTSTPLNEPLLPIQLIESFFLLLLFATLMLLFFKIDKKGLVAMVYIIAYAVLRFILEFFRGDVERGAFLNLSTSQWISLVLLCGTVLMYWFEKKKGMQKQKGKEKDS